MSAILLGCMLGLAQGMRHALEPDHVTAVSTLVAGQRTPRRIVSFAAIWGLGHALTLLVVGGALALFRAQMPPQIADVFELVVAFMLVALGVRALAQARAQAKSSGTHGAHGTHAHGVAHAHEHPPSFAAMRAQPLGVGIVHGLAGSGALAALATASFASRGAGVLFIAIYGAGAAAGMALLAAAAVLPMARLARNAKASAVLMGTAGLLSIALGASWGWPVATRLAEGAAAAAPATAPATPAP
jgi:hypothetical protein